MKSKFFALAFAAATIFASCSKEDNTNLLDVEGNATTMTVSLNFPTQSGARASNDLHSIGTESDVQTVDIFIYTGAGNFSTHKKLSITDFDTPSGATDLYRAKTKIATTTGAKMVFAGINLPNAVVQSVLQKPVNTLFTAVQTMTREELAGNTFAMFSIDAVNSTFMEDDTHANNTITIQCKRLVAKVTVETDGNLIEAGIAGIPGVLEFAISNFNTKSFLMQGITNEHKDPNWDSFNAADFDNSRVYNPILIGKNYSNPKPTDYKPLYAAENTSKEKKQEEITRVTVRTTFIPQNITEGTTGNYTVNSAHGVTTPKTYYAVTPRQLEAGTSYFFDLAVASSFAADNGGVEIITYENGYGYWDLFLNKNPLNVLNRWDVLRNDFYQCNITRITFPGRHTPEIVDPKETPDVDTNIAADIEILFWHTPIKSDYSI